MNKMRYTEWIDSYVDGDMDDAGRKNFETEFKFWVILYRLLNNLSSSVKDNFKGPIDEDLDTVQIFGDERVKLKQDKRFDELMKKLNKTKQELNSQILNEKAKNERTILKYNTEVEKERRKRTVNLQKISNINIDVSQLREKSMGINLNYAQQLGYINETLQDFDANKGGDEFKKTIVSKIDSILMRGKAAVQASKTKYTRLASVELRTKLYQSTLDANFRFIDVIVDISDSALDPDTRNISLAYSASSDQLQNVKALSDDSIDSYNKLLSHNTKISSRIVELKRMDDKRFKDIVTIDSEKEELRILQKEYTDNAQCLQHCRLIVDYLTVNLATYIKTFETSTDVKAKMLALTENMGKIYDIGTEDLATLVIGILLLGLGKKQGVKLHKLIMTRFGGDPYIINYLMMQLTTYRFGQITSISTTKFFNMMYALYKKSSDFEKLSPVIVPKIKLQGRNDSDIIKSDEDTMLAFFYDKVDQVVAHYKAAAEAVCIPLNDPLYSKFLSQFADTPAIAWVYQGFEGLFVEMCMKVLFGTYREGSAYYFHNTWLSEFAFKLDKEGYSPSPQAFRIIVNNIFSKVPLYMLIKGLIEDSKIEHAKGTFDFTTRFFDFENDDLKDNLIELKKFLETVDATSNETPLDKFSKSALTINFSALGKMLVGGDLVILNKNFDTFLKIGFSTQTLNEVYNSVVAKIYLDHNTPSANNFMNIMKTSRKLYDYSILGTLDDPLKKNFALFLAPIVGDMSKLNISDQDLVGDIIRQSSEILGRMHKNETEHKYDLGYTKFNLSINTLFNKSFIDEYTRLGRNTNFLNRLATGLSERLNTVQPSLIHMRKVHEIATEQLAMWTGWDKVRIAINAFRVLNSNQVTQALIVAIKTAIDIAVIAIPKLKREFPAIDEILQTIDGIVAILAAITLKENAAKGGHNNVHTRGIDYETPEVTLTTALQFNAAAAAPNFSNSAGNWAAIAPGAGTYKNANLDLRGVPANGNVPLSQTVFDTSIHHLKHYNKHAFAAAIGAVAAANHVPDEHAPAMLKIVQELSHLWKLVGPDPRYALSAIMNTFYLDPISSDIALACKDMYAKISLAGAPAATGPIGLIEYKDYSDEERRMSIVQFDQTANIYDLTTPITPANLLATLGTLPQFFTSLHGLQLFIELLQDHITDLHNLDNLTAREITTKTAGLAAILDLFATHPGVDGYGVIATNIYANLPVIKFREFLDTFIVLAGMDPYPTKTIVMNPEYDYHMNKLRDGFYKGAHYIYTGAGNPYTFAEPVAKALFGIYDILGIMFSAHAGNTRFNGIQNNNGSIRSS